ncbi:MAG TPA: flagellar basal body P-ring formation chaperone FlgA, partial [Burkholderiaceae bacterium]|nr:flagellar basal body P-ring formation chaperone FlgA [Burkholderiaceae bacterium]
MKRRLLLFSLLCGSATTLASQAEVPPAATSTPRDAIHRFVQDELARSQPGLRAEISVGEVDPRLRLTPCERAEPFLRSGTRLWGRSFVGYRCLQHPGWSISVPVTVRLFGQALVAVRYVPALQTISADAVRQEEVEVTREPGGVALTAEQLQDHVCTRSVEVGQPVPLNCLRAIPAIGQGDPVKLVGTGSGFTISTDATALATAVAGEMVRVRTDSGRTISGIARKGRIVEVSF